MTCSARPLHGKQFKLPGQITLPNDPDYQILVLDGLILEMKVFFGSKLILVHNINELKKRLLPEA